MNDDKMDKVKIPGFRLIGIKLDKKTTNEGGQSAIDCGSLWQKFEAGTYGEKIPNKLGEEIYAVYYAYEGDYTQPFSYFIGYKVEDNSDQPGDLKSLNITAGNYIGIVAKGKMPACIADAWREIWKSDIDRAYKFDFEIYGPKSKDWNDAEVAIFVSI